MDLTDSIAPKSDQLNAEDMLAGPRTVTITEVRKGASAEQPVDIVLAEYGPGRPFKPSKTVRRILVAAWGPEASAYAGHRMVLYRDPSVKFGGVELGGIRVSHLSHIDKPMTVSLTTTRGKRAPYKVDVLPNVVEYITAEQSKTLHSILGELRWGKTEALNYFTDTIGRAVTTTKDLTKAEAGKILDALDATKAGVNPATGEIVDAELVTE